MKIETDEEHGQNTTSLKNHLDGSVVLGSQNPVGSRTLPGDIKVNVFSGFVLHLSSEILSGQIMVSRRSMVRCINVNMN